MTTSSFNIFLVRLIFTFNTSQKNTAGYSFPGTMEERTASDWLYLFWVIFTATFSINGNVKIVRSGSYLSSATSSSHP